jgi:hypothetical protein
MTKFVPDDERQRVLVLLVGVAEQFAVDNDEVISDSRAAKALRTPLPDIK